MLKPTYREQIEARLRVSFFDFVVWSVILTLALLIALTAVLGIERVGLQVAFMKYDEAALVYQIWTAPINNPDDAEQVTFLENGVFDFDTSPDGNFIAYSVQDFTTGNREIYLMDMRTKRVEQVTNCLMNDSDCSSPSYSPTGDLIAYTRRSFNSQLGLGLGAPRIWVVDLRVDPPANYPLFEDSQILGHSPVWSWDGSRIAFYDDNAQGILVYHLNATDDTPLRFVPTRMGVVGALSPDGTQMIYADMLISPEGMARGYLQIADLENNNILSVTNPNDGYSYQSAVWSPDGNLIVFGRETGRNTQVDLLNVRDFSITPLIEDERYNHSFLRWSPDGNLLVMQRFQRYDSNGQPLSNSTTEIWTYNLQTRELTRIAENSFFPRWLP